MEQGSLCRVELMNGPFYMAGPLFTSAERRWNKDVAEALRKRGVQVILPQEEVADCIVSAVVDYECLYSKCLEGIRRAKGIVAVLDGPDVDSGTAFECGYAHALGKPIIGVRSDLRSGGEERGVNAMLSRCCEQLVYVAAFNDLNDLVTSIIQALPA